MDPWAKVVDECDGTLSRLDYRNTVTVVGSRYRAPATGTANSIAGALSSDEPMTNGYCEMTVAKLTAAGSEAGVVLRLLSGTQHYVCMINGSGSVSIQRYNTTFTSLASVSITLPSTPFVIGGDILDDRIRCWVNGVVLLSTTDSTFTGVGRYGWYGTAGTAVANMELERWEAGPLKGPPVMLAGRL